MFSLFMALLATPNATAALEEVAPPPPPAPGVDKLPPARDESWAGPRRRKGGKAAAAKRGGRTSVARSSQSSGEAAARVAAAEAKRQRKQLARVKGPLQDALTSYLTQAYARPGDRDATLAAHVRDYPHFKAPLEELHALGAPSEAETAAFYTAWRQMVAGVERPWVVPVTEGEEPAWKVRRRAAKTH